MDRPKIIAVDFDGTLCENEWPDIGRENRFVVDTIIRHQQEGCKVILWTCRSGELLEAAIAWCLDRGIRFDAINDNLPEIIKPFNRNCRKVHADEYWSANSVIISTGNVPSIIRNNEDGGFQLIHWAHANLTVRKAPLLVRLKRWLKKT